MSTSAPYLLGRFLDPVFAVFVGSLSYYSYEQKVQRPEGHSLNDLVRKRWERFNANKGGDLRD